MFGKTANIVSEGLKTLNGVSEKGPSAFVYLSPTDGDVTSEMATVKLMKRIIPRRKYLIFIKLL